MNVFSYLSILSLMALSISTSAFAQPPQEGLHNGLSLQGFTGVLNSPSAHVTKEGDFYALYTNQKESKWRDRASYQDNYLFSVGFFSIAEIGGRLTDARDVGTSDLSGNVKFTSEPLTRNYPYVPIFAFGMQDLGGGAASFRSKYAVVSEDIWRLRLSVGYGTGPDRMKGTFAGGEFKAHDWLYLLGEYDTRETNVGARVVLPHFWKVPISFTATAKTSIDHQPGNFDIAVGFSLPLDFRVRGKELGVRTEEPKSPPALLLQRGENTASALKATSEPAITAPPLPKGDNLSPITELKELSELNKLKDRLIRAGFLNVRVGQDGKVVVLEYENAIFNHNELDALGVVSGMAAEGLKGYFESLRVVIKKKNIRMMQVTMPFTSFAAYLENGRNLSDLKESVAFSSKCDNDENVSFVGGDNNSSFLTTSLMLWPGLNTFVGTDFGAFDYVLSLKPDLTVNLWKGGLVNARWDIPFAWSNNLDDGKPFRYSRTPGRMERLMFFQGIKLLPDVMAQVGGGMYLHDLYGSLNELIWMPGEGVHRMRLAQFWGRDDKTRKETEAFLASYRYYFSPLDLFLEGTVGKFWAQDRGYVLELKRLFGDATASLYYKNSTAVDNHHWQAAGMQFSFPLTPRKDMNNYYKMQVRGSDEWSYAQETVLTSGSQKTNDLLTFPLAINPQPPTALYRIYYNRDRLSPEYVKTHLDRLREAWLRYGNKQ